MAGEVLDWPASPESIGFPLIFLIFTDFLDLASICTASKRAPRFYDKNDSKGSESKTDLSVKGRIKMIGRSQLLARLKDMLLHNCTWHIVLRFGDDARKNDGGKWGVLLRTICRRKNFFF